MASHAIGPRAPAANPFTFASALRRRLAIEAEIEIHLQRVELLIARLDRADGDCDLEDDDPAEEDDPSGDPLDIYGEDSSDTGAGILPTAPRYGVDQSRGPLNGELAYRAWQRGLPGTSKPIGVKRQ